MRQGPWLGWPCPWPYPSACLQLHLAHGRPSTCLHQTDFKDLATQIGEPTLAAFSKENSWDNRESIHVCQADLNLSHFPLALECGDRAQSTRGQTGLRSEQPPGALAPSARVPSEPLPAGTVCIPITRGFFPVRCPPLPSEMSF